MTPQQFAHFRILRLLEKHPQLTQRELGVALGLSVGKVNYLINGLIEKGHIKIEAFRRSDDKLSRIAYMLTPEVSLTARGLHATTPNARRPNILPSSWKSPTSSGNWKQKTT